MQQIDQPISIDIEAVFHYSNIGAFYCKSPSVLPSILGMSLGVVGTVTLQHLEQRAAASSD